MEKVAGTCPSPWGSAGRKFYAEAAARGTLPKSFTQTLATLHGLDWAAAGLSFLGVPESGNDFALREVQKWCELVELSQLEPHPILVDLIGWLKANAPETQRLSLVHGAYRTGNLLIDNDEVSAVLDWELQVIGDPMYDVAYVLTDLNREGSEALIPTWLSGTLFFGTTSKPRASRSTKRSVSTTACCTNCARLPFG